jgi:hypothetical protein
VFSRIFRKKGNLMKKPWKLKQTQNFLIFHFVHLTNNFIITMMNILLIRWERWCCREQDLQQLLLRGTAKCTWTKWILLHTYFTISRETERVRKERKWRAWDEKIVSTSLFIRLQVLSRRRCWLYCLHCFKSLVLSIQL